MRETRIGRFLSEVFGGDHHVQWHRVKPQPFNQATYSTPQNFATYDGDLLTRVVVLAHAHAVRVEVQNGGPGRVRLWMSERARDGAWHQRHPTLMGALAAMGAAAERDDLLAAPAPPQHPTGGES